MFVSRVFPSQYERVAPLGELRNVIIDAALSQEAEPQDMANWAVLSLR